MLLKNLDKSPLTYSILYIILSLSVMTVTNVGPDNLKILLGLSTLFSSFFFVINSILKNQSSKSFLFYLISIIVIIAIAVLIVLYLLIDTMSREKIAINLSAVYFMFVILLSIYTYKISSKNK